MLLRAGPGMQPRTVGVMRAHPASQKSLAGLPDVTGSFLSAPIVQMRKMRSRKGQITTMGH